MIPLSRLSTTLVLALLLGGCAAGGYRPPEASLPPRYDLPQVATHKVRPPEGSIFNADSGSDLYKDRRAAQVGDILLVKIVETSSGDKKAATTANRNSSVTGDVSGLLGFEKWLANKNSNFTPSSSALQAGLKNDFKGDAETKRADTVTATISARVIDVTPDGNLAIRGYREVRLNNETQYIVLSGLVRPDDISPDNSILSSNIADARIEYTGKGSLSDKQQPGWLARGLDMLWPF
ncbi:MAG: flagellar basal body L-ring protein FlgH [Desulfobacteraceae bacterium]|nr:flagellar basal body L-ring protein FlgH [Desulfobacteraceae bacterium]